MGVTQKYELCISFNIDLNNISLDDKFDKDDPDIIIPMRLLDWYIKFRKQKEHKKLLSEGLMPEAWHPDRWWDWCMVEDEKKETDPMFIEELYYKCVSVGYKLGEKLYMYFGTFVPKYILVFKTI